MNVIEQVEAQVLLILLVASLVAIIARRFRQPYTLALVGTGLFLGFINLPALEGLELNAEILLLLLLPALLFEAAFHIEWEDFRRQIVPIGVLSVFGVMIAAGATAAFGWAVLNPTGLVPGFGWIQACLFGSLIAATDPISVLALFRSFGVSKRLYMVVEGESLFNDGVAVVVFGIVAAVAGTGLYGNSPVLEGTTEVIAYGITTFGRMAIGGALVGGLLGGLVSALTRQIEDHLIEVTLTTLVAYGSFLLAEELGCSGVISTVCGGLVMGSVGARYGMSAATRNAVEDFWEYMAFLANSAIFLLVGLQLEGASFVSDLLAIVVAFVVVVIGRALAVYTLLPVSNRLSGELIPLAWRHVLVWGGLRGSLSMVLVATIPAGFPGQTLLVHLVFGVVAISLFVQGLTMRSLLGRLGLLPRSGIQPDYHVARLRGITIARALETLKTLRREQILSGEAADALEAWYQRRQGDARQAEVNTVGESAIEEQLVEGIKRLSNVERETLRRVAQLGVIDDQAASALDLEILKRIDALETAEAGDQADLQRYLVELLESHPDGSGDT
jgi:Na+:H+ antiporter